MLRNTKARPDRPKHRPLDDPLGPPRPQKSMLSRSGSVAMHVHRFTANHSHPPLPRPTRGPVISDALEPMGFPDPPQYGFPSMGWVAAKGPLTFGRWVHGALMNQLNRFDFAWVPEGSLAGSFWVTMHPKKSGQIVFRCPVCWWGPLRGQRGCRSSPRCSPPTISHAAHHRRTEATTKRAMQKRSEHRHDDEVIDRERRSEHRCDDE